jgi:hypothetical protein
MPNHLGPRRLGVASAAVVATALLIGSAAAVDAGKPSKPAPKPTPTAPSGSGPGSASVQISSRGTLEPSGEYANVDVTVTCAVGSTWSYGYLYVLRGSLGGSGTFSASCTGAAQVVHSRVVNGNRYQLGDWTATAYIGITRNGQQATATSTRTIQLVPSVTARVADQGQLTGTAGAGVSIAISAACPIGASGQPSTVSVTQGTAAGQATFTPTCDRFAHTLVLAIAASQGSFHTGAASAAASVSVGWNGESFSGVDTRAVTILESSTGDTTPPTMPAGLNKNVMGDGETWLDWGPSTDNATPTGLIVYEVYLNGQLDQAVGGGYRQAILYVDQGRLNTVQVVAVDGAGNRSGPATVTVDCTQGWCQ